MTFNDILNLPVGKVSRFQALESIHELGADARRKADTLRERPVKDPSDVLMIRWFDELADSADRKLEHVNDTSITKW
jgi:hypothetical protein